MEPPIFIDGIGIFETEIPNHALLDRDALDWLGSVNGSPLTQSQMTALILMRNGGQLTNTSFRAATGVQDSRVAYKELKELVDRGLVDQFGKGGSTYYELAASISAEDGHLISSPVAVSQELTDLQHQVYSALTSEPVSRREIVKRTGLKSDQVAQVLQALRNKGLATMTGERRSRDALWRSVQ
jgi:ATP-dependent DNA helicase RecG